jgi:hypothetical protein
MVLSPALPRSRPARRGPAVALAASLLAAGPALSAAAAEGEVAPVAAVAAADSVQASLPAPDSLTRAQVQARLDRAWRVRVFAGGDPVELAKPRVELEGVRGFTLKERSAVVALDATPAGVKLMPWEDLRRIEVGRPGVARGVMLGATAGAAMLVTAAFYVDSNTDADLGDVAESGMWTLAVGAALGFLVGVGHPLWSAIPF